ncbi:MAG TPA: hypothetical protein VGO46_17915 [Gemmatimonadaceae bacterium]|nr:hypothetical protein [Gemmatimonadaceae bacterium]
MIAAFDRDEPGGEAWRMLRELVEATQKLSDLRVIYRDIRSMLGAMMPSSRERLERELHDRFGPDEERIRDDEVVAQVRRIGRIGSEREYRIVQAHLDALPANADHDSEVSSLGQLLDEFMAGPR